MTCDFSFGMGKWANQSLIAVTRHLMAKHSAPIWCGEAG
ncbi:hypothetical protein SynRS9915_01371 [Synechococcus sp. RS9915]|nr:hypothetical protein SynRS9915_01371 [Synechococcus sp. RS9915]